MVNSVSSSGKCRFWIRKKALRLAATSTLFPRSRFSWRFFLQEMKWSFKQITVLVWTQDGILIAILSSHWIAIHHSISNYQFHPKLPSSFFLMYSTKHIQITISLSITKILGKNNNHNNNRNKLQNKWTKENWESCCLSLLSCSHHHCSPTPALHTIARSLTKPFRPIAHS